MSTANTLPESPWRATERTHFDGPACVGHDPELWMADVRSIEDGMNRGHAAKRRQEADIRFAKAICGTCPLQEACLAAGDRECGIWGGRTTAERGVTYQSKRKREHFCDQCGRRYKPDHPSRRYCGEECAATAHRKQSQASYHRSKR